MKKYFVEVCVIAYVGYDVECDNEDQAKELGVTAWETDPTPWVNKITCVEVCDESHMVTEKTDDEQSEGCYLW